MKQVTLDFSAAPSYAPQDFMTSECNALAKQWLDQWPNWPSYGAIIVGPNAAGKTHLLRGWQAQANAHLATVGEPLAYASQSIAIDDADTWNGKEAEQQLFHLLNQSKEQGKHILLTASAPPSEWNIQLKDLRSRLLSLPVWELNAPDDKLLTAVLSKHFSDKQVLVDPAVIYYIAARVERSFDAIRRIASDIDAYALAAKKPITNTLVRKWLDEQAPSSSPCEGGG